MFRGLLVRGLRLLSEMLNVDSFPSIYNDIVDGIPENYVHYYKKYLYEYEIENIRRKQNSSISLRSYDISVKEKERQLVINFKFDEK